MHATFTCKLDSLVLWLWLAAVRRIVDLMYIAPSAPTSAAQVDNTGFTEHQASDHAAGAGQGPDYARKLGACCGVAPSAPGLGVAFRRTSDSRSTPQPAPPDSLESPDHPFRGTLRASCESPFALKAPSMQAPDVVMSEASSGAAAADAVFAIAGNEAPRAHSDAAAAAAALYQASDTAQAFRNDLAKQGAGHQHQHLLQPPPLPLSPHVRRVLVEWMGEMCAQLGLGSAVLFSAVAYLDCFSAVQVVRTPDGVLQLLAITCLALACRQEGSISRLSTAKWAGVVVDPTDGQPLYTTDDAATDGDELYADEQLSPTEVGAWHQPYHQQQQQPAGYGGGAAPPAAAQPAAPLLLLLQHQRHQPDLRVLALQILELSLMGCSYTCFAPSTMALTCLATAVAAAATAAGTCAPLPRQRQQQGGREQQQEAIRDEATALAAALAVAFGIVQSELAPNLHSCITAVHALITGSIPWVQ
eukprot:XP_001692178.1 predicted protein [Chlamydomonas reinhardtii]